MVNEEQRVTLYQDYVATGIKIIAESYVISHGGYIELPSFIEMTHEKVKEPTAEEIVEHVKQLFA